LLFLDNPVGTGFSYTDTEEGFVTMHEQAGEDLQVALSQFFQLFPALRENDFYVTGESYAGKWVPACAYTVHERNKGLLADQRINLKGIAIGDGAMNPREQFRGFGDLLWFMGMVDESERVEFGKYEARMQVAFQAGDNISAFEAFDEMLNGDFYPYPTYYANVTGMTSNYFNFELSPDATPLGGDFVQWLNQDAVRERIHVGKRAYAPDNSTVEAHLKGDWMRDVLPELVPLLENYKVVIYNGQNDVILGPPLTEQFLGGLAWSGKEAYNSAKKTVWRRSEAGPGSTLPDVAGYVREVGKFTQVVVRGAGHMVPGDQPERALDMIDRFIAGKGFGAEPSTDTTHEAIVV
jgi:vitellogenic carboxypeptidase-like protein